MFGITLNTIMSIMYFKIGMVFGGFIAVLILIYYLGFVRYSTVNLLDGISFSTLSLLLMILFWPVILLLIFGIIIDYIEEEKKHE